MPIQQQDYENGMRIQFWLEGNPFAERYSLIVPAVGDEVRFGNKAYKIILRIFIYDERLPRVALNMEPVEHPTKTVEVCRHGQQLGLCHICK